MLLLAYIPCMNANSLNASRLDDEAQETRSRALMKTPMQPIHDKILFVLAFFFGSAISALGAILTQGETRWIFITLAVSILTCTSMALLTKAEDETIRIVVGRCLLACIGGVTGTGPFVHYLQIESAATNAISLAGCAAATCVVTFFIGYAVIMLLKEQSANIAQGIWGWFYKRVFGKRYRKVSNPE